MGHDFHGWVGFAVHGMMQLPFLLAVLGVLSAWALYIKWPHLPDVIDSKLKPLRWVLERKYGFDWFNENVLAWLSRVLGKIFWKVGDQFIIDRIAVDGSANAIGIISSIVRRVQSGFLYSYAFWMVIGLAVMLGWFVTRA
jgi:NADH-quinone oxidoreductase subunit L